MMLIMTKHFNLQWFGTDIIYEFPCYHDSDLRKKKSHNQLRQQINYITSQCYYYIITIIYHFLFFFVYVRVWTTDHLHENTTLLLHHYHTIYHFLLIFT